MKRVLLCVLAVVVLAGAGAAFFVTRMDADFIVRRIAEATQNATGAPLQLEAAPHLSLLPPGVRFGQARWSGSLDGCAVTVSLAGGMARLELTPLFSGNIVLSEIRLDRPEADIRLVPAGETSADTRAPAGEASPSNKTRGAGARTAPDDTVPFELARLTVTQGALRLEDAGRVTRVTGFNLALENLRRREEVTLQGDMVLEVGETPASTAAGARVTAAAPLLAGNLAFKGALRYYAPNLTFRQTSLAFTPLGGVIPRELAPLQLTLEGALDLGTLGLRLAQARLATPQARLTLQGQGSLDPPAFTGDTRLAASSRKLAALGGLTLPDGAADSIALVWRTEVAGTGLRLAGISGEAAGVSLDGDLSVDLPTAASAPALRGSLRLGTVALDTLLPTESAETRAPARAPAGGKIAAGARPRQATTAADGQRATAGLPTLDLRLAMAALRQGAFSLHDIAGHITGRAGRYSLGGLAARLAGGGALKGDLSADLGAHAYSVSASGSGVDIGALCAAAGKAGVAAGTAAFTVRLKAAGADSRALLASLDGEGVLEGRNLTTPALRNAAQTLGMLRLAAISVPERVDTARAPFAARGGEITARPITVTASGLSARGEARVSLTREYVDGTATVTTAGLNIPLTFKGPLSDVSVSVDPKFALELGRKLGNLPGVSGVTGGAGNAGTSVRDGLGKAGGLVRGLLGR